MESGGPSSVSLVSLEEEERDRKGRALGVTGLQARDSKDCRHHQMLREEHRTGSF